MCHGNRAAGGAGARVAVRVAGGAQDEGAARTAPPLPLCTHPWAAAPHPARDLLSARYRTGSMIARLFCDRFASVVFAMRGWVSPSPTVVMREPAMPFATR